MLIKEIGQLLPMQRDAMQGASWAKMMSPRSKLIALACHPTKN
jgi:hypothetical protein